MELISPPRVRVRDLGGAIREAHDSDDADFINLQVCDLGAVSIAELPRTDAMDGLAD